MILFLEFASRGHRGGEVYHRHLHQFLKDKYDAIQPDTIEQLPDHLKSRKARIMYSRNLVDRYNPKLIVCDISSSALNFSAISKAKKSGAKLLLVVQGARDLSTIKSLMKRKLIRWAEKYVIDKADIILANSNYSAEMIQANYNQKELKFVVAYPGTDVKLISSVDRKVISTGKKRLLFVGECSHVKGLATLVEAISMLGNTNITLDIAGGWSQEPKYYQEVCNLIKSNHLEDQIRWHGFVTSEVLSDLYINSDILVAPSLSEGYGMAVAEALLYGLPIIASRVGGIAEIVHDSKCALLVKPSDSNELANAIDKVLSDKILREKMSGLANDQASHLSTWSLFRDSLEYNLVSHLSALSRVSK